jgi:hypothetical protein
MKIINTVVLACLLISCSSTAIISIQKRELFNRFYTTRVGGEFPTSEQAETICPDISVLLDVTEKDLENWVAEKTGKKEYDIYPLLALSTILSKKQIHRDYVTANFDRIRHPELKNSWAVLLFYNGERTTNIIAHLKKMVATIPKGSDIGMNDEEWQKLKEEVMEIKM